MMISILGKWEGLLFVQFLYREENMEKGEIERSIHKLIGEILIDEGVMEESQVKEVLEAMTKT